MIDLAYPLRQAFLRRTQSRFWAGWYRLKTLMGIGA